MSKLAGQPGQVGHLHADLMAHGGGDYSMRLAVNDAAVPLLMMLVV